MNAAQQLESRQQTPSMSAMPSLPSMPSLNSLPSISAVAGVAGVAGVPVMPATPQLELGRGASLGSQLLGSMRLPSLSSEAQPEGG